MNNPHGYSQPHQPHLGATFYPGGVDDFYIPEVISPSPQRIMREVPENMQDNIAHLEHEAYGPNRVPGPQSPNQYQPRQYPDRGPSTATTNYQHDNYNNGYGKHSPYAQSPIPGSTSYNAGAGNGEGQNYGPQSYGQPPAYDTSEQPNFSPFPILRNPPSHIPPTDEQREANLELGRKAVLGSNDPEMQLHWAADALSYVEVAMQNEQRIATSQAARPQTPQVEHQLKEDAVNVVTFLANQGHPRAEFLKGMWLEFGKFNYRIDKREAFHCYSRAADKGYARAEYRIGMQFESSNETDKAIKYYYKGVEAEDSASNYRLGMMILLGQHGQRQDNERGLQHIRFAAETADENAPQGSYVYGMLLARELPQVNIPERSLPLDLKSARTFIEKAAFLGFAKAQVKMGSAYELCQLGCDFNPELSLHYNALAARQGEADAEMAISKWFLCGHEDVFDKNEEMAFVYAQRAAQSGLPTAEFAMGYFYEIGIYVPVNLKEARSWYSKAAANGNKDASARIDSISRSKTLSRRDHEKIAISKIQSQYGSHRQDVANRNRNGRPAMPPIPDNVEMPDPSKLRISPDPYGDSQPQRPPPAAPYPTSGGPGSARPRPGNNSSFFNPELRPNSAFRINPNIRPSSAATTGSVRPDNYRVSSASSQQRPYSAVEDFGPGYGRGGRIVSGGPGPQGYRQPGTGLSPSPKIGGPPGDPGAPQLPKLDIGFSAPLDPQGADRRRKLQRSDNPNLGKPQPLPPKINPSVPPERVSSRTPVTAGPQNPSSFTRKTSPSRLPGTPASAHPGRMESLPGKSGTRPGNDAGKPPTSATNKPLPSAVSNKPATPSGARPPAKGPKTFEEMGVPQGKSDNDCVVM